jgi:hypothetical protein
MKKSLLIATILFCGCASKHPCLDKREVCLSDCERIYPKKGAEYNICKSACYTSYGICKAKRKIKKIF